MNSDAETGNIKTQKPSPEQDVTALLGSSKCKQREKRLVSAYLYTHTRGGKVGGEEEKG